MRYTGKSRIDEISLLKNLFICDINRHSQIRDYLSSLEAQLSRLSSINSSKFDSMKVALLLSSLSNLL